MGQVQRGLGPLDLVQVGKPVPALHQVPQRGGVGAALKKERIGLVDIWLRHVQDVHAKHAGNVDRLPPEERHDRLCELNVLEQVINVCQTYVVQDAWRREQSLTVHGWIYGLEDGLMHDLGITVDPRLIEAGNFFEGKVVGVGDGVLRHPEYWSKLRDPFTPSWGEAYAAIASRMIAAVADARDAARGHEALLVSHQLPVWTARSRLEGRRLWHDPRKRQCALASLTSLTFDDDRLVAITYTEPSADLVRAAGKSASQAKGA